jgi:hypothetical protein
MRVPLREKIVDRREQRSDAAPDDFTRRAKHPDACVIGQ